MKTKWFEWLDRGRTRMEARDRRQWQWIHRLGKQKFIVLFIGGFWLMHIFQFLLAAWMILLPSRHCTVCTSFTEG